MKKNHKYGSLQSPALTDIKSILYQSIHKAISPPRSHEVSMDFLFFKVKWDFLFFLKWNTCLGDIKSFNLCCLHCVNFLMFFFWKLEKDFCSVTLLHQPESMFIHMCAVQFQNEAIVRVYWHLASTISVNTSVKIEWILNRSKASTLVSS